MRNKEKGITLIALIITIIVMLILVGVVVTVVIQSNLLGTAKTAGDKYKTAYEDESNMSEVTIDGKKYASIEDYLEGNVKLPEIKAGERASETSKYQTAVIPKGFTVSNATGEKDVSTGLVIYDIPKDKLENVKWDGTEKTEFNQFVWIPVEVNKAIDKAEINGIQKFSRTKWTADAATGGKRTEGLSSDYTEPYTDSSGNDYDSSTGIKSQIENLTKSIYKYGGFYIGRYEAGSETERTWESKEVTPIGIKQDMYPYNYVKWGESMSDIGTKGAVYLSNSLYNSTKPNYGATSMLCTGACWDSMLDFIKDEEHNVTSSSKWGNYRDSETYKIYRGNIYRNSAWISADATNGTEITQYQNILLTTGATERNSAKNIYDVAGSCYEWTTESKFSRFRVYRGGFYGNPGSIDTASIRNNDYRPNESNGAISFRPSLYVNL